MKPSSLTRPGISHSLLIGALLCGLTVAVATQGLAADTLPTGLPDWTSILKTHGDRLAAVDSDQTAKETFVSSVGPALHLADAAGTIGAKGIPVKLANELLLPDVIKSAQRLIAALNVWRLADAVMQSLVTQEPQNAAPAAPTERQQEWLQANGPFPSLAALAQFVLSAPGERTNSHSDRTALAVAAGRASMEASQQTMAEWSRLKSWKDRVRSLRGQARLCGTWQWVIHNHQAHHQEQKLSLLFPPPGSDGAGIPGLTETIVLGDTVYLRWESSGKTQEDSLLFSKEGQRLEGTFVNSQGGWGSISGKRTASCTP